MNNSRFKHGSGVYVCLICQKKTRATGGDEESVDLCAACYEEAGLENEHNDYGHAAPVEGCPTCNEKVRK